MRLVDLAAALGHAAGAQADADLAHRRRAGGRRVRPAAGAVPLLLLQEIVEHVARPCVRREPAVGHAVDLDHRGQRAAAQAGDLLRR